jgi:hypothetical protein
LTTSFPEKTYDVKFIDQRSSWASMLMKEHFGQETPSVNFNHIADYVYLKSWHSDLIPPFSRWFCGILQWQTKNYDRLPSKMLPVATLFYKLQIGG